MLRTTHSFVLEFRRADGQPVGQVPLGADWGSAREWTEFAARRSMRDAGRALDASIRIEPIAHESHGLPHALGFRVIMEDDGETLGSCEFSVSFFARQAQAAANALVEKGALAEGEHFVYLLLAYPEAQQRGGQAKPAFEVARVLQPLPLRAASLADLSARAVSFGVPESTDFPVFLPQQVMEETVALTEEAGADETGGILIGHLVRDERIPDIGAVVTAQIPVRHTEAGTHHLTFTPATWSAVRCAIALRRSDEIMVGWWHSHPARFWTSTACANCEPEKRKRCPLTTNFFSGDDVRLHETVFPKAFQIALVATNTDDGIKHALFGWRHGVVRQRGFRILKADRPMGVTAAPTTEVTHHETPCQH